MPGNPILLFVRAIVAIAGLWVVSIGVGVINGASGDFLNIGQHMLGGIVELAFGVFLVAVAIAPQQVIAALSIIVKIGH